MNLITSVASPCRQSPRLLHADIRGKPVPAETRQIDAIASEADIVSQALIVRCASFVRTLQGAR
jgi:hypothetical protein